MRYMPFNEFFYKNDFTGLLKYTSDEHPPIKLLPFFAHTFRKMFNDCNKKAYSPWVLKAATGIVNSTFSGFHQNDVSEFLTSLMDILGSELVVTGYENIFEQQCRGSTQQAKKCLKCKKQTARNEAFIF